MYIYISFLHRIFSKYDINLAEIQNMRRCVKFGIFFLWYLFILLQKFIMFGKIIWSQCMCYHVQLGWKQNVNYMCLFVFFIFISKHIQNTMYISWRWRVFDLKEFFRVQWIKFENELHERFSHECYNDSHFVSVCPLSRIIF